MQGAGLAAGLFCLVLSKEMSRVGWGPRAPMEADYGHHNVAHYHHCSSVVCGRRLVRPRSLVLSLVQ